MEEVWKDIPGWDGCYQASDHGRVKSLSRFVQDKGILRRVPERILAFGSNGRGHLTVNLWKENRPSKYYVHELVALIFIGPRPEGLHVLHYDDDKLNNHVSNLRYGTQSDNQNDRVRNGNHHNANKVMCPFGHTLCEPNLVAASLRKGIRACLACNRARARLRKPRYKDWTIQELSDLVYKEIMAM